MNAAPDYRLTPARADLAAAHLRGQVEAERFVEGRTMRVAAPLADVKRAPAPDASLDTQAIRGETVVVYEDHEGWAWAQIEDGYVGYLPSHALTPSGPAPTHRVCVARTFIYPGPNMKLPPIDALPFGAKIAARREEGGYAILSGGGAVFARHLRPVEACEPDFVAVAEGFIGAPYLWGGKAPQGLDCSGLVQVALHAAGLPCPRDTDMQERALGEPLDLASQPPLRRGDLVFWRGHVGVMRDPDTLLHANGHHMLVASEPFAGARGRIAEGSFGQVTSIRRLRPTEP